MAMRQHYGWWSYDSDTRTMQNDVTGQTVTEHRLDSSGRKRIVYRDADVRYTLYATRNFHLGDSEWMTLRVDYDESAKRQSTVSFLRKEIPSYGLWRRIDDCITDALLVWPDPENEGRRRVQFDLKGGWLNGEWKTKWIRRFSNDSFRPCSPSGDEPQSMKLVSLDMKPPKRWTFVDAAITELPRFEGLSVGDMKWDTVRLPSDVKPTGFETAVPHLMRGDGEAHFIPMSIDPGWAYGERYTADPLVLYFDPDVVCVFSFSDGVGESICGNYFPFRTHSFRQENPPSELIPIKKLRAREEINELGERERVEWMTQELSRGMWDHFYRTILDGFSCWKPVMQPVLPGGEKGVKEKVRIEGPRADPLDAGFDLRRLAYPTIMGASVGGGLVTSSVKVALYGLTQER